MIAHELGRRERKKRQTENAIEEAAVTLALELGHAAVTVPDICERADVSRSTFFNYMPSREAAIFGPPLHLMDAEPALALLGDDPPTSNATALFGVILASLPHSNMNPAVAAGRARLLAEQPETQSTVFAQFGPMSAQLNALAFTWLTEHPARRVIPDTTVFRESSITSALVMSGFLAVINEASGPSDVALSIEAFERAIADTARIASA